MFKNIVCFGALMTLAPGLVLFAGQANGPTSQPRIRAAIDDRVRVTLRGNTRPEAAAANDLGQVEDSLPLEHVQLDRKSVV